MKCHRKAWRSVGSAGHPGKNRLFEIRLTRRLEVSIVARLKANAEMPKTGIRRGCLRFHLSYVSESPSECVSSQNEHCGREKHLSE